MLALTCSGCVGFDAYRPTQTLSIRVNGEQSGDYTLFLVDEDKTVLFGQTGGVHTVELPGTSYGTGIVFFVPISSNPEKRESVVFRKHQTEVAKLSVRSVRKADRADTGTYLVELKKE